MKIAAASRILVVCLFSLVTSSLLLAQNEPAETKPEPPLLFVKTVDEAEKLPATTEAIRVLMPRPDNPMILAVVLRHAPNIHTLHFDHPANRLPEAAIHLLSKFAKLRDLRITGDARLDDATVSAIGELSNLESLQFKLP